MNGAMSRTREPAAALEGVTWDLAGRQTYGGYLKLPELLSLQQPSSPERDELLFIVIHQASELWLKLQLHELEHARDRIAADDLSPAFKMLSRVARIQTQMIQSWEILATMTPSDYSSFRESLGPSSGFQSHQYRALEFLLGAKNETLIEVHRGDEPIWARMVEALNRPSLYDEALRLLARRGFELPPEVLERDWSAPYRAHPAVEAAWLKVYHEPEAHWELYDLAEKLVDLEYRLQQWRFAHMKTVERVIGQKRGTGGSSGVGYLSAILELRYFPELLDLRTAM